MLWRWPSGEGGRAGLIYHTDRGAQYTAPSFGNRLEEAGIGHRLGVIPLECRQFCGTHRYRQHETLSFEGDPDAFSPEEAHQESVRAPLQSLERMDPPLECSPRLRTCLDPKLEARFPRRRLAVAQPHGVPRAQRRFGLGDEGYARRGDVDSRASAGQGDGSERGGVGFRHRRSRGLPQEEAVADRSLYGVGGRAATALLEVDGRVLRRAPQESRMIT